MRETATKITNQILPTHFFDNEIKKEIITDSVAKMKDWMCPDTPNWMPQEVSTGTTLVAMEFADGVVLGADTRWGRKSIFYLLGGPAN